MEQPIRFVSNPAATPGARREHLSGAKPSVQPRPGGVALVRPADNPHVVNQIVDAGLCVRCGACEPACPVDIIRFNDQHYPYITKEEDCIRGCVRCLKVCPGHTVDFGSLDQAMFGKRPHPESITGNARRALVGYSTDEAIRQRGTSGGFVTQLLVYMLDQNLIDGALVLGSSVGEHGWQETPLIARTVEELKRAGTSKYMVAPFLKPLREMEKIEGRYAIVGVPCYVHAIRKYQKVSPKLRDRLKLVIGLYCNAVVEPRAYREVCELNGLEPEEVVHVDFRSGHWPGGVTAKLRDGSTVKLLKLEEMKEQFNLLKLFHAAPRCNLCVDFSAEYADLAVGDPWLRGPDGQYLFPDGRTCVLVRTQAGEEVVNAAVAAGCLRVEEIPIETYMVNFENSARYKRDLVPKNIDLRRRLGMAVPEYNIPLRRPTLWSLWPAVKIAMRDFLSRSRLIRTIGIRLAQTPPVLAYFSWNRVQKGRRFSARYRKSERLVERLRNSTGTP